MILFRLCLQSTTLEYIHRMRKWNAAVDIVGENLSRATQTGPINEERVAAPLIAKSLARDRKKKMQEMQLWKKRKKTV